MSRTGRQALVMAARVDGHPVAEVRADAGRGLVAGPSGSLCVPTPDGTPWVARARWTGAASVEIRDGRGDRHALGPGETLAIRVGGVEVQAWLVPDRRLRRTAPVAWSASIAWLLTVMGASLIVSQTAVFTSLLCPTLGLFCPPQAPSAGGWNAEYLARLLENDVEGEERGRLVMQVPEEGVELPSEYMPAGDVGPKDRMGGAEEVAPEPVRQVARSRSATAARRDRTPERAESLEVERGTPLPEPEPVERDGSETSEGIEEADEVEAEPDAPTERAEEERGWGIRDWMDMTPEQRQMVEQEMMRDLAERRLRIDPEDPAALSVLAYYQYLSEDFAGAMTTYDRLLDVEPESPAAYNNKALVYKRQGRYAEEEGLYRVALSLDPDDTTAMNNLAVNLAHQGRTDEALAIMERLETLLPNDPYSDLHRAKIHAERGDDAQALAYLEQALAGMAKLDTLHHIEFRQDIRLDPSFASLRQDPRFHAILEAYYGEDSPLGGRR